MSGTLVKFELRGAKKKGGGNTGFFDESHQHVLHQRSNGFYTVALRGMGLNGPPMHGVLERSMSCQLARISLDGSVLAVQVSDVLVVVVDIDGTKRWRIKVRSGLTSRLVVSGFVDRVVAGMMAPGKDDKAQCILLPGGIVWTNHGGTSQDLMLVTTRGMEFLQGLVFAWSVPGCAKLDFRYSFLSVCGVCPAHCPWDWSFRERIATLLVAT